MADKITVGKGGWEDFDNIQDGIDYSSDGDIVEVKPGTYNEKINFYGKKILVTSTDPNNPSSTHISSYDDFVAIVRFDSGEGEESVLIGFMISNTSSFGTAIYCYYSSPIITNIEIEDARNGIYGYNSSSYPKIINSYFHDDVLYAIQDCHGQISDCLFYNTRIDNCDGSITNCIFRDGNGAYYCDGLIENCIFYGCGIGHSNGSIINCTITHTDNGLDNCNGEIRNCIIAYNNDYGLWDCKGDIIYNNVWSNRFGSYGGGTIPSPTDIHLDPLFAGGEDYHLKSEAGRFDPNQTWIIDNVTSPCIDAGDPVDGVGDEPQPHGDRINIGAYGGTAQASKTPGTGLTFPGMVENLSIQGEHKQISLVWDDPNYTGGLPITVYNIYRGTSSGGLVYYDEVGEGEMSFIDTDVQNDTVYFYTVSAVSGFGEGPQITPVSKTASWLRSDLNGDGIVNLIDWFIFSSEWLFKSTWYIP
ncbi:hypothetical protein ACFL02_09505 [Planctomycetota bacterium]